eukprot:TRINITY_DN17712_c0_g1_i1.p3 TRINITY_DN17712_c0_g1~~TRINITY_DN17712_c0_g1_i1.p3  ORF type:complete len:127 (-),score=36.30 TRINITY_DN17712_c0_g1_i1:123-503(-)
MEALREEQHRGDAAGRDVRRLRDQLEEAETREASLRSEIVELQTSNATHLKALRASTITRGWQSIAGAARVQRSSEEHEAQVKDLNDAMGALDQELAARDATLHAERALHAEEKARLTATVRGCGA